MEGTRIAEPCRFFFQRRAGVGDRDEAMAGLVGANGLRDARMKIVFQRIRFSGAAGLAGHDEHCTGNVDHRFQRANLSGVS